MDSDQVHPGDQVTWNLSRRETTGTVQKEPTGPTSIKGHQVAASKDDPQYLVETDGSEQQAAHRPALGQRRRGSC